MKQKPDRKNFHKEHIFTLEQNRVDFDEVAKQRDEDVAAVKAKTTKRKTADKAKSLKSAKEHLSTQSNAVPASNPVEAKADINFQTYMQLLEMKAYELYLKRGCQHGCDQDDWYEAEKLMREEMLTGKY